MSRETGFMRKRLAIGMNWGALLQSGLRRRACLATVPVVFEPVVFEPIVFENVTASDDP